MNDTNAESEPGINGIDYNSWPPGEATLRRLYVEEGLSGVEIGRRFDRDRDSVYYQLEKHGINRRPNTGPARTYEFDPDELRELYWERNMTLNEIGDELGGADGMTIRQAMIKHGIPRRPPGVREGEPLEDRPWRNPEILYEHSVLRKRSTTEIGDSLGTNSGTVLRGLRSVNPGLPGGYFPDAETERDMLERIVEEHDPVAQWTDDNPPSAPVIQHLVADRRMEPDDIVAFYREQAGPDDYTPSHTIVMNRLRTLDLNDPDERAALCRERNQGRLFGSTQ